MSTELSILFGPYIDFGPCIVGMNLNQFTVRGFGDIATLAMVSGPDVYDKKLNPTGTQRELQKKHASEAYAYAVDSTRVNPMEHPRSFPEVLFNVRDASVVEFYDIENPDQIILLPFTKLEAQLEGRSSLVGMRVLTSNLEFPQRQFDPQISRVDGNHRLSSVPIEDMVADRNQAVGVTIPFCVFVEMNREQEVMVFADINGNVRRMNVDHIQNIAIRVNEDDELKLKDPALWLANQLTLEGGAFYDSVYFGGSKAGHKLAGKMPQVNLNALKKVQQQMLGRTNALLQSTDEAFEYFNNYWLAVRQTFPVEWNDKKGYILLQAIGLTGFAGLGATLIVQATSSKKKSVNDFAKKLELVKSGVSLAKTDPVWEFAAGPAGGKKVEKVISTLIS
jgi:DGQHR domain-containing protein